MRVNTEIDHYSSCTKNGENGCYIYLYISDVHISGRNLNFPYISLFSVFHRARAVINTCKTKTQTTEKSMENLNTFV